MTSAIFGICSSSMLTVSHNMSRRYGKNKVVALPAKELTDKRLQRAKLFLVDGVNSLHIHRNKLNTVATPILVFDNSTMLRQHAIPLLDAEDAGNSIIRRFAISSIDYPRLFAAVEQPTEKHQIHRKTVDVLTGVIAEFTVGGFLDKFNSFLYAATTPTNRPALRNALVSYIFESITLDNFKAQAARLDVPLRDRAAKMLQEIVDYLASDKGKTLRQALHAAVAMEKAAGKNSARRTVRYSEITSKYAVDRFELQNLLIIRRGQKPATRSPLAA